MIAATCRTNLLTLAGAFAKGAKCSLGTVSKKFYGHRAFLDDFRNGKRSISVDKLDDVIAKMAAEWPDGTEWPLLNVTMIRRPADLGKKVPAAVAEPANQLPGKHVRGRGTPAGATGSRVAAAPRKARPRVRKTSRNRSRGTAAATA